MMENNKPVTTEQTKTIEIVNDVYLDEKKHQMKSKQSGEKQSGVVSHNSTTIIEEEDISPEMDPNEEIDIFVDEHSKHIIIPGDFSTTYIPVDMEISGITSNNRKTK